MRCGDVVRCGRLITNFSFLDYLRDNGGPIVVDGMIGGLITPVTSDGTTDVVALVDASQIAASSGVVAFKVAKEATLDMAGGNSPTFDFFQKNAEARMIERLWGCEILDPAAIALITDLSVTA